MPVLPEYKRQDLWKGAGDTVLQRVTGAYAGEYGIVEVLAVIGEVRGSVRHSKDMDPKNYRYSCIELWMKLHEKIGRVASIIQ